MCKSNFKMNNSSIVSSKWKKVGVTLQIGYTRLDQRYMYNKVQTCMLLIHATCTCIVH